MKFLLPALLVTLAVLPAGASASAGLKHSSALLATCDTNAQAATFRGKMGKTRPGLVKQQLQMRFSIQMRTPGGKWKRVPAPAFWVTAEPGKTLYIYDKLLEKLALGASYRAIIHFRWRNPHTKKVLARATRTTSACKQPDLRANLKPVKIRVTDGSAASTVSYEVTVANTGEADTAATAVGLSIAGTRLPDQTDPGIVSGDRGVVSFEAAPCAPGSQLVALVDTTMVLEEADEADNTLTVPCPISR